ncbi:MAG TPA: cytochrome D1 domain-containing protein, partial [Blastocatellia bacterium]|nr:cytochrome D1 domain-containing protein [Blastocatellia bacterium]
MRSRQRAGSIITIGQTGSRLIITWLRMGIAIILLWLAGGFPQGYAQEKAKTVPPQTSLVEALPARQTYTREGVSVEFSIEPIVSGKVRPTELLADSEATVRFKVVDASGGKALGNLRPAAWIDRRDAVHSTDARECREKIQSFLQHSFNKRASISLNTYFILALNREPNISVIDPLSGFGGTKLYTLVPLSSSGEDWELSPDKKRLYVSMPLSGQVAVIDTVTWKVIANIDAGAKPARLALQHDSRYLWVGNDAASEGDSGGTVIDTVSLKVVAQFKTGAGHHEIALAEDDSFAFITNKQDGTLSVIDVRKLARVKEIKIGSIVSAIAFSPLSKAIYVASEGDGTIVAVDSLRLEILARMKAFPGVGAIRILPDGRFGFVVNPAKNAVYIFDVSSNRMLHTVPVGPLPDQIAFTRQFAYVRSAANAFVTMIKIVDFAKEGEQVAVTHFPAGEKAPKDSPASSLAEVIVPAPEEGAVLVANPADKMIYYYAEGMAAPMGSFQNYRRDPKALLVLDNSLAETASGVYTTTVRLGDPGHYDVAFLLD